MLTLLILSFVTFLVGRVSWNFANDLKEAKRYVAMGFVLGVSWIANFIFIFTVILFFTNILLMLLPPSGVSV